MLPEAAPGRNSFARKCGDLVLGRLQQRVPGLLPGLEAEIVGNERRCARLDQRFGRDHEPRVAAGDAEVVDVVAVVILIHADAVTGHRAAAAARPAAETDGRDG